MAMAMAAAVATMVAMVEIITNIYMVFLIFFKFSVYSIKDRVISDSIIELPITIIIFKTKLIRFHFLTNPHHLNHDC